jgi:hypothetical protein
MSLKTGRFWSRILDEIAINLIYVSVNSLNEEIEGKKACLLMREKFYMLTSQVEK